MSARLMWVLQDADGDAQTGQDVKLYRKSDSALIGTFSEVGSGMYWIDHTISERVYIKVAAVLVTGSDGMMFPADDVASAVNLASTANALGASLIGIEDAAENYLATTVEGALIELGQMIVALDSTEEGQGASLVAVRDAADYFNANNVESVLQEVGAITTLLEGLTASAAELNALDGVGASVTGAALNTLTNGSTVSTLHTHDMATLAGNVLKGAGATDMNVSVQSQYTALYNKGSVFLDVYHADGSGKAYVRTGDESEVQADYEIMTAWEIGDRNFSGIPLLSGLADPGKISEAIKIIAQQAYAAITSIGFNRLILDRGGTTAGSATGNTAGDPAATVKWQEISATPVKKRNVAFVLLPEMRTIWLRVFAMLNGAGSGSIKIDVDSSATATASVTVTAVSITEYTVAVDLKTIAVTVPTMAILGIYGAGDGTKTLIVYEKYEVWVEA